MADTTNYNHQDKFNVRTITGFVQLLPNDFSSSLLDDKIAHMVGSLRRVEKCLQQAGYTVQTVRLATNPFGEWLAIETLDQQLKRLDAVLASNQIDFCALGPAETVQQVQEYCTQIVAASSRFSCSASLAATDISMARAAAGCIRAIAALDGLGNFRFCVAAAAKHYIPFFPIAMAPKTADYQGPSFAVGLENGVLAQHLLKQCGSLQDVDRVLGEGLRQALTPIQTICQQACQDIRFVGIDSSLNPSLEKDGSVAKAMEMLVPNFGGPGTRAVAAAITKCLQSLPGIQLTGYCGLMLPLCEDQRLAELANKGSLRINDLLSISHVCGVGIDTVPIPGNVDEMELAWLLLDVAGMAHRWGKSLSCRVFPVPDKQAGDKTSFDSPYMVNSRILSLSP